VSHLKARCNTEKSLKAFPCLGVALSTIFVVGVATVTTPSVAASTAPAHQSDCEIKANRFKAKHPHIEPFDFMKLGFFYFGEAVPPSPPQAYRDAETGIVLYVETDGRHIAAIGANGKLLWVRDPFVDRNMCPYRSAHPYIAWIGASGGDFGRHYLGPFEPTPDAIANARIVRELNSEIAHNRAIEPPRDADRFIGLSFNSSQFGYVNIRNGDFYEMGQD